MEGFWANFGFFAALGILILGYHTFMDYREMKRPFHRADERVYEAADAFLHGETSRKIAAMLQSCLAPCLLFHLDDLDGSCEII